MTTINNLENMRAAFAYEKAEQASNYKYTEKKHDVPVAYKNYVKKIIMMVKNNGLGSALAFVKAKAKSDNDEKSAYAYHKIYEHLTDWFETHRTTLLPNLSSSDLVSNYPTINLQKYLRMKNTGRITATSKALLNIHITTSGKSAW